MFNVRKFIKDSKLEFRDSKREFRELLMKSLNDGSHPIYKVIQEHSKKGKSPVYFWKSECVSKDNRNEELEILSNFFEDQDMKTEINMGYITLRLE